MLMRLSTMLREAGSPHRQAATSRVDTHPLVAMTAPSFNHDEFTAALRDVRDWPELLRQAERNKLFYWLAMKLRAERLRDVPPGPVQVVLGLGVTQAFLLERRHAAAWRELAGRLEDRGLQPVLLKGQSLTSRLYGDSLERVSGDIDVLVSSDNLRDAEVVLQDLGYRATNRDYYVEHHFHLPYSRIQGGCPITVELHWQVAKRSAHVCFEVDDWIRRARILETPAGRARVAPPGEEVAYLAYHALARGAPTLRDLSDVTRLWHRLSPVERARAFAAARRAGASGHLILALEMADNLWGMAENPVVRERPRLRRWLIRHLLEPQTVIALGHATWWPFRRLVVWGAGRDGAASLWHLLRQTLRSPWEAHFDPEHSGRGRDATRLCALALAAGMCCLPRRIFPAAFRTGR